MNWSQAARAWLGWALVLVMVIGARRVESGGRILAGGFRGAGSGGQIEASGFGRMGSCRQLGPRNALVH